MSYTTVMFTIYPTRNQIRDRYGGSQPSLQRGNNPPSTNYSNTIERTVANIVASVPEFSDLDEIPDVIPAAPIPGRPGKLARFSRSTEHGQKFFTDKQVLGCLVREGKSNQRRVDLWKTFVAGKGELFLSKFIFLLTWR
jgi:hypothetical protein